MVVPFLSYIGGKNPKKVIILIYLHPWMLVVKECLPAMEKQNRMAVNELLPNDDLFNTEEIPHHPRRHHSVPMQARPQYYIRILQPER